MSDILHKYIDDSDTLHVDRFMIKYLNQYKSEIIEKLNLKYDNNQVPDYNRFLGTLFDSFDDVEKWIKIIEPAVHNDIMQYAKASESSTLIVDSFMLPTMELYKHCKYTISVSCELPLEVQRLKNRLDDEGKVFDIDTLIKRAHHSTFSNLGYKCTYNIQNNGTLMDLENNVNKIIMENLKVENPKILEFKK